MKKASKLLWILLAVLLAVFFTGCKNGNNDDDDDDDDDIIIGSSTTMQTFYIPVLDTSRDEGYKDLSEINRLHLHAPEGVGFKIEKIFRSNTKTDGVPADADMWYDFTKGDEETDYQLGTYGGTIAHGDSEPYGTVADGVFSLDNSAGPGQKYAGNLGIAADDYAYIGFRIANYSETAKFDNLQLEFHRGTNTTYNSKPAAYFFGFTDQPDPPPPPPPPPDDVDLTEWTAVYYDTEDPAVNTIIFHVNSGFVEIQKILVNSTKSLTGASTVLDFTQSDPDVNVYWSNITSEAVDTGTADGRFVIDKDEYTRWDAFGSGAAYDNSAPVWIFIIRTTSEGWTDVGNVRVQFGPDGDPAPPVVNFSAMDL